MKRKRYIVIAIALVVFMISACSYNKSMVKVAFDTLTVSKASYETAMNVIKDLNERGLVPASDKNKVIEVAYVYSKAHNLAVEALAKYKESGDLKDQALFEKQITMVNEALVNLLEIINPYLEN